MKLDYDVFVIGGGINGVGVAADAATRGLHVALCEQNDLASATSSNSSKLIHGGLRYLEHYEFRLVREALAEREVLLANAPHIMWPLRFALPHQKHLRPQWMIRIGMFLYDNLAKRVSLPASKKVHTTDTSPLIESIKTCFEYSDGWVDDARLVTLNAMQAHAHNATIMTQTECVKAENKGNYWAVTVLDKLHNVERTLTTKSVVNASGPWVESLFTKAFSTPSPKKIRLVKGSHIVVPKIHSENKAYILQNADNRIVFVLPYEDDFSLVGTTDVDYQGNPKDVEIDAGETQYIIDIANAYFKQQICAEDVVHTFSGVRPLIDDGADAAAEATRDYTFDMSHSPTQAPLLSIFGGKITTYRKLAEAAVDALKPVFPQMGSCQTKTLRLPGGDFSSQASLIDTWQKKYAFLTSQQVQRFARQYGVLANQFLDQCHTSEDLGQDFGAGLTQAEVDYLVQYEFVTDVEDILWRRTKLGLHQNEIDMKRLTAYLASKISRNTARQSDLSSVA